MNSVGQGQQKQARKRNGLVKPPEIATHKDASIVCKSPEIIWDVKYSVSPTWSSQMQEASLPVKTDAHTRRLDAQAKINTLIKPRGYVEGLIDATDHYHYISPNRKVALLRVVTVELAVSLEVGPRSRRPIDKATCGLACTTPSTWSLHGACDQSHASRMQGPQVLR